MEVCIECKREIYSNFQTIQTSRKSKVIICNDCISKMQRKEADNARDSKESLREHK